MIVREGENEKVLTHAAAAVVVANADVIPALLNKKSDHTISDSSSPCCCTTTGSSKGDERGKIIEADEDADNEQLARNEAENDNSDNKANEETNSDDRSTDNNSIQKILPKNNKLYNNKDYWEDRFQIEVENDWLLSYQQLAPQIRPLFEQSSSSSSSLSLPKATRILVIGCGNSPFSADLYDDGYHNIMNIDFSTTVIQQMQEKHAVERPGMEWRVMDMTDMDDFSSQSFDVVFDKATMDAMLTLEGDVWNPDPAMIQAARSMCRHVSRILQPGGIFVSVSLVQPHFRKKYLLGWHGADEHSNVDISDDTYSKEFAWSFRYETAGNPNEFSFGHFLYIMVKA